MIDNNKGLTEDINNQLINKYTAKKEITSLISIIISFFTFISSSITKSNINIMVNSIILISLIDSIAIAYSIYCIYAVYRLKSFKNNNVPISCKFPFCYIILAAILFPIIYIKPIECFFISLIGYDSLTLITPVYMLITFTLFFFGLINVVAWLIKK